MSAGRGIWIINGPKSDIAITDVEAKDNGLVGIDVNDGTVTGLTITGNNVSGNGDSGIGVLGAEGPDANLVSGNTVTNNGRYGIEIKNATGNGAASAPAASSSRATRSAARSRRRMRATTRASRSSAAAPDLALNADQPSGVYVTGNTVTGFHRKRLSVPPATASASSSKARVTASS